jgi:hypothetical protein
MGESPGDMSEAKDGGDTRAALEERAFKESKYPKAWIISIMVPVS